MNRATFNALPVMTHAAANAGGVAYGAHYLTQDLAFQKTRNDNRVRYYTRIVKIRDNEVVTKVMPFTNRVIPGWEVGDNPPSRVVTKTDPYTGASYNVTETITASGAWPSGAIDYDTSSKSVTGLIYPDFPDGTSQQTDGYVSVHDVLTD